MDGALRAANGYGVLAERVFAHSRTEGAAQAHSMRAGGGAAACAFF
jgi:hypothetical protein